MKNKLLKNKLLKFLQKTDPNVTLSDCASGGYFAYFTSIIEHNNERVELGLLPDKFTPHYIVSDKPFKNSLKIDNDCYILRTQ